MLDDPDRSFASSLFVKLEVLPKAVYNCCPDEVALYRAFFEKVTQWAQPDEQLIESALAEGEACGLGPMDALHVAAAVSVGASELVTTERPEKPIHRARAVAVRSIHPATGP